MSFTFDRNAQSRQWLAMAELMGRMGDSNDKNKALQAESASRDKQAQQEKIMQLIQMAVKANDFGTAESLSGQAGLPQGVLSGIGTTMQQDAASAAEAKRLEAEQSANWMRDLVVDNKLGGTMTDQSAGMPGIAAPRDNRWQTEETVTPGKRDALLAMIKDLNPTQLKALQSGDLGDDERLNAISYELNTKMSPEVEAKTAADTMTAEASRSNAQTNAGELGLKRDEFGYRKTQDSTKAAADIRKEAAAAGLSPEAYKNFAQLDDDMRTATKPQREALASGRMMAEALKSGNSEVAQGAMIVFLKALDDSVAREGEVAALVSKMGGITNIKNKMSSFISGKADPTFNKKMEGLISMVNGKNEALLGQTMRVFDVRAQAAGPDVGKFYDMSKAEILGGSSAPKKPTGASGSKYVSMD